MYFIGGPLPPVKIATPKGEARILDEVRLESKIPCHPDRRFDGVVGAYSSDHERIESGFPQMTFKLCTNECAICALRNNDLA